MKIKIVFTCVIFSMCAISCGSSSKINQTTDKKEMVRSNSLSGELRKESGVTVRGNDSNGSVMIGGYSSTLTKETNPLFILDGQPIGHSLPRAAQMMDVTKIKSIRIIRASESFTRYGRDGSNGAIEIRMLKTK